MSRSAVGTPLRVQLPVTHGGDGALGCRFSNDSLLKREALWDTPVSIVRLFVSDVLRQLEFLDHHKRHKDQRQAEQRFQQTEPLPPKKVIHSLSEAPTDLQRRVPLPSYCFTTPAPQPVSPLSLLMWRPQVVASSAICTHWHWSGTGAHFPP